MTEPLREVEPDEDDEVEVDVDLDLLSDTLRKEAVGEATTVRIDGTIIHVSHAGDWSSTAMRSAASGDWETWAREVIFDDEEFQAWMDADLHNYQIEAVFNECGRQARLSMGKSRRHSGSRRNSRRK
jgi:hypothetical protein